MAASRDLREMYLNKFMLHKKNTFIRQSSLREHVGWTAAF